MNWGDWRKASPARGEFGESGLLSARPGPAGCSSSPCSAKPVFTRCMAERAGATQRWQAMTAEYAELQGQPFDLSEPMVAARFWGQIRPVFRPWLRRALSERRPGQQRLEALWDHTPGSRCSSPAAGAGGARDASQWHQPAHEHAQEAGLVLGDVVTAAPFNQKGNRNLPIEPCMTIFWLRLAAAEPPDRVSWRPVHQVLGSVDCALCDEPIWGFGTPARCCVSRVGWMDFPIWVGGDGSPSIEWLRHCCCAMVCRSIKGCGCSGTTTSVCSIGRHVVPFISHPTQTRSACVLSWRVF